MTQRHKSDSAEQKEAEALVLKRLADHLSVSLEKKSFRGEGGSRLEVDGYSDDPLILCEAWAHQGKAKSAQKNKVMTDAFKLCYVEKLLRRDARKILALADEEAASTFGGRSWMRQALAAFEVEIVVVGLAKDVRRRIRVAQQRQYR